MKPSRQAGFFRYYEGVNVMHMTYGFGKKKNFWKWAAAAAAGTALALSLAGCGGSQAPASSAAVSGASGQTKVVIGTTGTLAKWTQTVQGGSGVEGYDIDVWNEIAKRNHWDIEWKVAEFQALFGMLDNGQLTTIANEVTTNPQRLEKYTFSDTYAWDSYVFVTKPDYDGSQGMNSFKGKKVAVEAATNPRLTLEKANDEMNLGIDIGYLDGQATLLPAVANGQYDAAFMIKSAAYIGIHDLKYDLKAWESQYKKLPICYAFRKTPQDDQIREAVNKTLAEMHQDGTLTKLSEKWFGEDMTPEPKE